MSFPLEAVDFVFAWGIGSFGRLQDITGEVSNFITTVAESESAAKVRLEGMGAKLVDLSYGIVGLGASVRHTSEEQLKSQRSETKFLSDISAGHCQAQERG